MPSRDPREPREPRDTPESRRTRWSRRDPLPTAARLDLPREARRRLIRRPRLEEDTFGRFAEQFARFMGTARFLLYMTAFVVIWIVWNWLAPEAAKWDAYPYIFLTLILSLQASYAAPLILLAQNRQEDRDRVLAEGDRRTAAQSRADMEFLAREMASLRMALGEVATRDYVRSELRALLGDLEEREERRDGTNAGDREEDDAAAGGTGSG